MDRKQIIGFLLIASLLIAWMFLNNYNKEKDALAQKHVQDSLHHIDSINMVNAQAVAKHRADSIAALPKDTTINQDSILAAKKTQVYGVFAAALKGDTTPVVIENEKLKAKIYPKGGRIGSVELKGVYTHSDDPKEKKPLILFYPDSTHFGLGFFDKQRRRFNTDSLFFTADKKSFSVAGKDSNSVALRLYTDTSKSSYIEYLYSLRGNSYLLGCTVTFVNGDKFFADDQNTTGIDLNWSMATPSQEKSVKNQRPVSTVYFNFDGEEDVDYLKGTEDGSKKLAGTPKWISFKQQYFSSILIAGDKFANNAEVAVSTPSDPNLIKRMSATVAIPYSKKPTESFPMHFYFGPNKYSELKSYNLHLEREIDLGWSLFGALNRWVFIPIFTWLGSNIASYGIVILLLTVIVKILLFPIAYKSFLSSAKMRVLKPEIDEINSKFGNDDPLKKQQATMELYRKAGVNPAAGCIPLLLQIPILFALIRLFPAAYELRQQSFLWATDLSTYDSVWNFGFNIPGYGDHMSLFALLMTGSTLLYTWMNQQMLSPGSAQLPGMKYLIYIMPVFFLIFLNSYSAALSYYYFVSNLITFGQMWLMRRYVDEGAIRAKIEENKKKPKKGTSGFMQRLGQAQKKRLDEMKKQQGQLKGGGKKKS